MACVKFESKLFQKFVDITCKNIGNFKEEVMFRKGYVIEGEFVCKCLLY